MYDIGKVSLIVPIYNSAMYLSHCIESICHQSYKNIELILVNDGSTDNSLEICKYYSNKYDFIKIITQKNSGVSAARNAGIRISTGEYFTFVDSDDWLDNETVKIALDYLQKYDADVVTYGWKCIFEDNKDQKKCVESFETIDSNYEIIKKILTNYSDLGGGYPWNKIWKRSSFQHIEMFDQNLFYFEDLEWAVRMMKQVHKIVICPYALYNYFVREMSITNRVDGSEKRELGYHQSIGKILENVSEMPEVISEFREKYYIEIVNGVINAKRKKWSTVEEYLINQLQNIYREIFLSKRIMIRTKIRCGLIIIKLWRYLK